MQRFTLSLVSLSAFTLAVSIAWPASATILNFNIDNNPSGTAAANANMATVHPNYGDAVSSTSVVDGAFINNYGVGNGFTPNIQVTYTIAGTATEQRYYTDGDAAVSPLWKDVNFLIGSGGALFRQTFVPDNPLLHGVKVNSFDVFGYSGTLAHTMSWTLRQDNPAGTIIASGAGVLTTQTHASPLTIVTGAPAYFGTVVLEINHLTGSGGAFGMDNLNFDQILPPVPEPSTLTLLGLGLVGLCDATDDGKEV